MASVERSIQSPPWATRVVADLTIDRAQRAVFRDGVRLDLPRLTFDLFVALVDAAPAVLTQDLLAERVWRGRPVTPETVAQRVLLLRRALGDDAQVPRYVRVVRGVGVQLAADARDASPRFRLATFDPSDGPDDGAPPLDLTLPAQPSVVVLPFDADEGEPRAFAHGFAHDLITRLGRARDFFVIARGTAFRFAPGTLDLRELPRRLGVRYAVQGHVRCIGNGVRIDVSLADAVRGCELWADSFHDDRARLFELQETLATRVASTIAAEVDLAEQHRARLAPFATLDAWSAYHRGCWHMYRFTAADFESAERCFEHALSLDPRSARALAGLSFVHWQRAFLEIGDDRALEERRALDLARRSLDADARDPLAHWALGRAYLLSGEVDDAVGELETATELNPSFAVGQYTLGFALMQAGALPASIERAERARRLSPYDPLAFAMVGLRGFSLALAGEVDEAAALLARSIRQPNAHHHMVAMAAVCDTLADRGDAARLDWQRLQAARPGYDAGSFLRAFRLQRPEHVERVETAFRTLARLD